jgi:hypothetical protein
LKFGPPVEAEGVVESEQGHAGSLGVAGRLGGKRRQFGLGLVVPALGVGRFGGQKAGFETGAFVDGGACQLFGEGMVVA